MMVQEFKTKRRVITVFWELFLFLGIVFLVRTIGFGLYQVPSGSMETTMLVGERFFADKFSYWLRNPRRGEIVAFNAPPIYFHYARNPLLWLFQMYVWGPVNWTKRIIGVPGDVVRGIIEDGKPVIYLNDKKINEPYVNAYPLLVVWKDDPVKLRHRLDAAIEQARMRGENEQALQTIRRRYLLGKTELRSFDPTQSFDEQPFYTLRADRVGRRRDNTLDIRYPGSAVTRKKKRYQTGTSYWDGSDEFYVTLGANQYWVMGDNRLGSKDSRTFGPINGSFIHGRVILRIWSLDSDEVWWFLELIKHPIEFWKKIRYNRFFTWLSYRN
jgi:signal peptidase I